MADLHNQIDSVQVTYELPAPNGQEVIPNQQLQNVETVVSSTQDVPGTTPVAPSHAQDTYTIPGRPDVWTFNPNLTQVFPVNKPPQP